MLSDAIIVAIIAAIGAIQTETVEAEEKDVNFYDYDGTRLYSYSASDFANLSAMPSNPTHTGLTAPGASTNDNRMKLTSPLVYARCSAAYFSTAAAAAVDTANSTIAFSTKVFQVDKPNVHYQLQKMISDDWRALT